MRSLHVIVRGRVQGVGFRAWVEMEATARGLHAPAAYIESVLGQQRVERRESLKP